MRHLYLSSAILATLTVCENARSAHDMWKGPYAGLSVGYESGNAKIFSTESGVGYSSSQKTNIAFKGPGAELVMGWGKPFNKYYLGLEASASIYNSEGNTKNSFLDGFAGSANVLSSRVSRNDSFGLVVRGGYKIHETVLLYLKAGAASTKFNLKTVNRNNTDPKEDFTKKSRRRVMGIVGGLGAEVKLTDHLLGRIEASHIQYSRINLSGSISNNSKVRFKPQSNEIKVGIVMPIRWK
jgi:opacity protein-like surface antigen